MSRLRRRQVEDRAWQLLEANGIEKPPVPVEKLARQLGYELIYQRLPGDISGTVLLDDGGDITIGINSFHAGVRQRFSVAHELGHAQLHLTKGKGQLFVDPPARVLFRDGISSLGEDPVEVQANQFAAGLLMPGPFVADIGQRIIDRNPGISVDDLVSRLARRFEVSPQAMRYRLVTFGVLEPE